MLQIVAFGSYGYSYCLWLRFIDVRLCITSLEAKSYLTIVTTRAGVTFRTGKKFTGRSITAAFAILFTLLNNYDINMLLTLSDWWHYWLANKECMLYLRYPIKHQCRGSTRLRNAVSNEAEAHNFKRLVNEMSWLYNFIELGLYRLQYLTGQFLIIKIRTWPQRKGGIKKRNCIEIQGLIIHFFYFYLSYQSTSNISPRLLLHTSQPTPTTLLYYSHIPNTHKKNFTHA